ncbi:MAG: T9SS type A sorting domain-containing protein, partial [Bacteroidetes bacterium]|nr:T9SS type A sorting domain-containing protein [Bacteroidota bacterium]
VEGFNLNIPPNATIEGISVVIKKKTDNGVAMQDNIVQLSRNGSVMGSNYAKVNAWNAGPSFQSSSYGSATDKWGTTLVPAIVNASDFGISISAKRFNNGNPKSQTPEVDYVEMSVSYTVCLPISLIDFSAKLISPKIVDVKWQTATEINNASFELLKSTDGNTFETINNQKGAGFSSDILNYHFEDRELNSETTVVYYKLKQIDINGAFEEFGPISIVLNRETKTLQLFPNPGINLVTIQFDYDTFSPSEIGIYNSMGEFIRKSDLSTKNTLDVSDLAKGIYLFKVSNYKTNEILTTRFIKN